PPEPANQPERGVVAPGISAHGGERPEIALEDRLAISPLPLDGACGQFTRVGNRPNGRRSAWLFEPRLEDLRPGGNVRWNFRQVLKARVLERRLAKITIRLASVGMDARRHDSLIAARQQFDKRLAIR